MNSVGVPRTAPVASPLSTSRRTRARTPELRRSTSNRATSSWSSAAYRASHRPRAPLAVEEELVHLPEPILERLLGRCEGVRVNLVSGKWRNAKRMPSLAARRVRSLETPCANTGIRSRRTRERHERRSGRERGRCRRAALPPTRPASRPSREPSGSDDLSKDEVRSAGCCLISPESHAHDRLCL